MKIRDLAGILRRIIGAPDYDAYLAHFREHHPADAPMDQRAFHEHQLDLRYARPGSRCC